MIENVQLARATVAQVLSIHLTFKPYGWATFYVDDAQGTLAVESDWGSYAHRWGRGSHLGVEPHDLSLALATRLGADYVARKLFAGNALTYDERATRRAWRDEVLTQRRRQHVDADTARWAWDATESGELSHEQGAVEYALGCDALREVLGDEPWYHLRHTESPRFLTVRDVLLPAFIAELRKTRPTPARVHLGQEDQHG